MSVPLLAGVSSDSRGGNPGSSAYSVTLDKHLIFLSLIFLICKVEITKTPTSQGCWQEVTLYSV